MIQIVANICKMNLKRLKALRPIIVLLEETSEKAAIRTPKNKNKNFGFKVTTLTLSREGLEDERRVIS
jgi:hypothetical protein